ASQSLDIHINALDEIFVLGNVMVNGDSDVVLFKMDTDLEQTWCKRWGAEGSDVATTFNPSADEGLLYVAGFTTAFEMSDQEQPFLLSIATSDGTLVDSTVFGLSSYGYFDFVAADDD